MVEVILWFDGIKRIIRRVLGIAELRDFVAIGLSHPSRFASGQPR